MAEVSYPYSGAAILTELQLSSWARNFALDGVIADGPSSTALKATSSGLNVSIPAGSAQVNGFHYENTGTKVIPIPPNGGGTPRVDRIVIRSSQTANQTTAERIAGGASPPALTKDRTDVFEIPCVKVTLAPGGSTVTLEDERIFVGRQVAYGNASARRDPSDSQLLIEDASTGNPKLLVGTGAAWKQIYPGDKWTKTTLSVAKWVASANTWQDFTDWPAVQVTGVVAGDQLEICHYVSMKGDAGTDNMGASFRISGVGIGEAGFSHELVYIPDAGEKLGFNKAQFQIQIYTATVTGTAVITPQYRTNANDKDGWFERGYIAARIVR
jgi:hypothetical protein